MSRKIQNISFAVFAIHWLGALFQAPAIYPFLANPIMILQKVSPGINPSQDTDFIFLSERFLSQELVPADDEYETNQNETLSVASPGVMGNDNILGANAVLVDPAPSHGEISLDPNGSFTYTPDVDFIGEDFFNYMLEQDGEFSEPAVVQITVLDTQSPQVVWVSPVSEGEVLVVGFEWILLEAEATDNGVVAGVLFYRWDAYLGEEGDYVDIAFIETAPYQFELDTKDLNPGWNQLFVRAMDEAGNASDRSPIWVFLVPRLYFPIILR